MTMTKVVLGVILFILFETMCPGQELPSEQVIGKLDVVATFNGPMPTGVSVSNSGRIYGGGSEGRKDPSLSRRRDKPLQQER